MLYILIENFKNNFNALRILRPLGIYHKTNLDNMHRESDPKVNLQMPKSQNYTAFYMHARMHEFNCSYNKFT